MVDFCSRFSMRYHIVWEHDVKFIFKKFNFLLKVNCFYVLNFFDVLISKIIFLKIKKYYFNIFYHEKYFKKQPQSHLKKKKVLSLSLSLSIYIYIYIYIYSSLVKSFPHIFIICLFGIGVFFIFYFLETHLRWKIIELIFF